MADKQTEIGGTENHLRDEEALVCQLEFLAKQKTRISSTRLVEVYSKSSSEERGTVFVKSIPLLSLIFSVSWSRASPCVARGASPEGERNLHASSLSFTKPFVCVIPSGKTYAHWNGLSFPGLLLSNPKTCEKLRLRAQSSAHINGIYNRKVAAPDLARRRSRATSRETKQSSSLAWSTRKVSSMTLTER